MILTWILVARLAGARPESQGEWRTEMIQEADQRQPLMAP